jgi:hypothetical protein
MKTLRRAHAHPDRTFSRLTVGFYNAVLSMRLRRAARDNPDWGLDPDGVRTPFGLPPDDGEDGLAGSRVPRRPLLGGGSAASALIPDEDVNGSR